MQGTGRAEGVRRGPAQLVRRASARPQRQAPAAALRARLDRHPAVPGPGLPARLLRGRELRGRQGQVQALGVDHVSPLRGQVQPAHRSRGDPRQRRQAGVAGAPAQHRGAAPLERPQQAQGTVDQLNRE